ncbi:hypothetical protein [Bacillus sp. FJAT-27445]|uniref:hypothetical protein n=1 Tax=Bacillus sp. FJAT-27445 TaxID=1679166 RepID=UPI0007432D13|nr:hypothetical protein [Bacillus sp. FJAT-27445]
MKFFINFLPLLLVGLAVINYMYLAKDIFSTAVLLLLSVIFALFNLYKKKYVISLLSIGIVISIIGLFSYLVNAGI